MANSWLRLYHDMPNDPKWRTIAKVANQTIPVVLAVYVHLLTIASGAIERGTLINVNSEDLASALDVDCVVVDAVLEAMQGRVLDGEKLSGWEKRQVNREDSSTERVKRYRERKVTQVERTVTQVKPKVTADKKREEEIREVQRPKQPQAAFVLPTHIEQLAWNGYEEMRRKKRCALTDHGRDLCLKKLESLKRAGHDPTAVLNQSTMNGWQGLFELKGASNGIPQQNRPDAATDRQRTSQSNVVAAVGRRYGARDTNDSSPGVQTEPIPAGGDAGPVPASVGGDSPTVRNGPFQGRTLEGVA